MVRSLPRADPPPLQVQCKIGSPQCSTNAALRHTTRLEFLSILKSPSDSYTQYSICIDAPYAKIKRITPEGQTPAGRGEELSLFFSTIIFTRHWPLSPVYLALAKVEGHRDLRPF